MPPFVFKIKFYLPGGNNGEKNAAHARYIATRPGADRGELEPENSKSAKRLEELEATPDTAAGHVKYAAERPRSHGLFGADETSPNLKEIQEELKNHDGPVWRAVLSLREDDAQRLGYVDRAAWERTLRATVPMAAKEMGIEESQLRWTAAFHAEKGHPHCHLIFWQINSLNPRQKGALNENERKAVRRVFINGFYAEERTRLYAVKNAQRDLIRDLSRNSVKEAISLVRATKQYQLQVRELDGTAPGVAPVLREEVQEEFAKKLEALAQKMPGKGRLALAYMPEAVKNEARQIADWLLNQPGFADSVAKHLEAVKGITRHQVSDENAVKQAEQKAYADLIDRTAQDIIKGSGEINRSQNFILKGHEYVSNDIEPVIDSGPSSVKGLGGLEIKNVESLENQLWRSVWRTVQIEISRLEIGTRIQPLQKLAPEQLSELFKRMGHLSTLFPEEMDGKPALVYLPEDAQVEAKNIANWLLNQNGLAEIKDKIAGLSNKSNYLTDKVAEKVVTYTADMLPRKPLDIEILVHEERKNLALERLKNVAQCLVTEEKEEMSWTVGTMYRALIRLGESEPEAKRIVNGWAQKAGFVNVNDVIDKEVKKMKYVELKNLSEGKDIPLMISQKDWARLRENLGFKEEEFLSPWFGIVNQEDRGQEAKQQDKPQIKMHLVSERVDNAVNALKGVSGKPLNHKEVQWTVKTFNKVLYSFGLNEKEREGIILGWIERANLNLPVARLKDVLDRTTLVGDKNYFIGRKNWQRLMNNLGVDAPPKIPWMAEGLAKPFNIASRVWKSTWQSVERERTRTEAKVLVAKMQEERLRKAEELSRSQRERDDYRDR